MRRPVSVYSVCNCGFHFYLECLTVFQFKKVHNGIFLLLLCKVGYIIFWHAIFCRKFLNECTTLYAVCVVLSVFGLSIFGKSVLFLNLQHDVVKRSMNLYFQNYCKEKACANTIKIEEVSIRTCVAQWLLSPVIDLKVAGSRLPDLFFCTCISIWRQSKHISSDIDVDLVLHKLVK